MNNTRTALTAALLLTGSAPSPRKISKMIFPKRDGEAGKPKILSPLQIVLLILPVVVLPFFCDFFAARFFGYILAPLVLIILMKIIRQFGSSANLYREQSFQRPPSASRRKLRPGRNCGGFEILS